MSLANKIFRTKKIQKNQKKKKLQLQFRYASLKHTKQLLSNFNPLRRRWLYHSLASQQYVHFFRNPTLREEEGESSVINFWNASNFDC